MINAWNRREFLKTASQATLAALAAGFFEVFTPCLLAVWKGKSDDGAIRHLSTTGPVHGRLKPLL